MMITGTNLEFYTIWDADHQHYDVYKGDRFIIRLYNFRMVKNYLN